VILNFLVLGTVLVLAGLGLRFEKGFGWGWGLVWWGSTWWATALLMVMYAKFGKFRQRDRILDLAQLGGGETVLDVGTGRGLLAIGAARRLTTGRSIGIDVFQKEDLSGNSLERTQANLVAEGVEGRVEIRADDARKLSLESASVDRVVSNLCLHNLYKKDERAQALAEIVRVLKPGGRAVISDYKLVDEYAAAFRAHGLTVAKHGPYLMDTFPPLRIVVAIKPA
jgi:ubiquinone/menaquinone biosynthesis C-methylase UbiE